MTKAEIHKQLCDSLHQLYLNKNSDYDDSYSIVRDIIPASILVRLYDKLTRLKTLLLKNNVQKVKDESINDTLMDLSNYALLELVERIYERQEGFNPNDKDEKCGKEQRHI